MKNSLRKNIGQNIFLSFYLTILKKEAKEYHTFDRKTFSIYKQNVSF